MYKKILKLLQKSEGHGGIRRKRPHFIFSAENPRGDVSLKMSHQETMDFLNKRDYTTEEAEGKYGDNEKSIIVHDPREESISHLHNLASNLGQESSVYSDGYNHEMHFHHGDKAGSYVKGKGTKFHHSPPDDNYTSTKDGSHFTHNFDFDQFHQKENTPDKVKHSVNIRSIAEKYATNNGIELDHTSEVPTVDKERAAKIAQAYSDMEHNPNHPEVKKSYNALIDETSKQFDHIKNSTNMKFSKITGDNPYKSSKDMFKDINTNNHMWYYPTETGFGSGENNNKDHPMLAETSHSHSDGKPMVANDVFRIVHDYFGHAKEGNGFGPKGEEHAWNIHRKMYSPSAQGAMTTETRGQNSWVNFGPKGDANRANPSNTQYAEQKAGLLPSFAHDTQPPATSPAPLKKSEEENSEPMTLHHYSNASGIREIKPSHQGSGFDSNTKGRDTGHKMSFFYPSTVSKEDIASTQDAHVADSKHKYTVKLDKDHKIYNASSDKSGFSNAARSTNNGVFSMEDFVHHIKSAGYHGMIIDKHPTLKPIVAMFYPTKVHSKELSKAEDSVYDQRYSVKDTLKEQKKKISAQAAKNYDNFKKRMSPKRRNSKHPLIDSIARRFKRKNV